MIHYVSRFLVLVVISISANAAHAQQDVADIQSVKKQVPQQNQMNYFLMKRKNEQVPKDGFKLLMILPGGNGSAQFEPFIKRILKHALPKDYIVVQPVAVKWNPEQIAIWPTSQSKKKYMKFTTEQFVDSVLKHAKTQIKVNPKHIYIMGWSSSGPALYATALRKKTPFKGSYIAMSVFKENNPQRLKLAKDKVFYIEHSKADRVCPYWMAEKAHKVLKQHGAKVIFKTAPGGHGWLPNPYLRIKTAITNLENRSVSEK